MRRGFSALTIAALVVTAFGSCKQRRKGTGDGAQVKAETGDVNGKAKIKACEDPRIRAPTGRDEKIAWVKAWVNSIDSQSLLETAFFCANKPTGEGSIPTGRGQGLGTLFNGLDVWNGLQTSVGSLIWGGKQFFKGKEEGDYNDIGQTWDDGKVRLFNFMNDNGKHRYNAEVEFLPNSLMDGEPSILLNYTKDKSKEKYPLRLTEMTPAQILVDQIAPGIHDEIRELQDQNGQPSSLYIGRASLQNSCIRMDDEGLPFIDITKKRLCGDAEGASKKFTFGANFFLYFAKNGGEVRSADPPRAEDGSSGGSSDQTTVAPESKDTP